MELGSLDQIYIKKNNNYVNLKLVNTTKYRISIEDARKAASINQIYYQTE